MPKADKTYPPELIARAREAHRRGGTQEAVGIVLGCSQQTAGRRIKEWGWPRVRSGPREKPKFRFVASDYELAGGPAGAEARAEEGEPDKHRHRPPPRADLPQRLRALVAREMTRVELCGGPPAEVARTLAALARTLKLLHTLPGGQERADEEEMDAEEFEREIARRLEHLMAEDNECRDLSALEEFAARFERDGAPARSAG